MINRLLILSALPLAIATSSILLPNKTIANQPEQIAENVTPTPEQEQHRPPEPPIDFVTAAKKLGVTEAKLKAALGIPFEPPPRPDIRGAATKLNVTEDKLIEALGLPPRPLGDCSQRKE
ncbi:MAG: hypothetical protein NTY89_16065 [Nostocales cyanobacterium LacPavin_0920_SED1_MAG_38_18]|jgi:hypothetical protein|uniref:Uncharacterized protein n=1 Tax=Aphanizomenon flos-aquae FACHB-1040 TaxID=2692887 RepID=A0ABR8BSC5_APHFL|nr:hypothetical protein [Aphanizomenon flos-aquae]MBD2277286.1 hypothetical protein [Aphanizomenon flos-aquae FACHB-1040]MCX5983272.1 hypothetical protein [Nostocales cyanobacterium LacPavin_0920_SED1_MAG_38_18]